MSQAWYFADLTIRWVHVTFAILWIGTILATSMALARIEKEGHAGLKADSFAADLLGRFVAWQKWNALLTLIVGLLLFGHVYTPHFEAMVDPTLPRFQWIFLGMALGVVMVVHTWFLIVPAHRRLEAQLAAGAGESGEASEAARRLRSVTAGNFYLAMPVLAAMMAGFHLQGAGPTTFKGIVLLIAAFLLACAARALAIRQVRTGTP